MPRVAERFTERAARAAREAIADAGGNEVFLLGGAGDGGRIDDVRVLARGNRHAAPAILQVPRAGEVVIHNHPSGPLHPSDADIEVASALGNEGVGSYIVDNAVERLYVVVEPLAESAEQPIDREHALRCLGPQGPIAAALPGYEHRRQQLAMLDAVSDAFNRRRVLTVEAGTGTGKSLAYLVPAILWAKANRKRVVVSTHTINLQEQLVRKDLPFLVERAGLQCTTALVKGRGNYLCKRKAAQVQVQGALVEDEVATELRHVLAWAKKTSDGSLADLPARPRPEVWEQVVSESDNCLRARCPYYSECFFYTARRAAASADVLVVNHHLLMADLALRDELADYTQNAVLPPSGRVVIDEAHHLEDVATAYFGTRVGLAVLERVLGRLQSRRNPAKGVLPALQLALESLDRGEDVAAAHGAIRWLEGPLSERRATLSAEAEECFAQVMTAYLELPGRPRGEAAEEKLRITPAVRATAFWSETRDRLAALSEAVGAYAVDFCAVLDRIERLSDAIGPQIRYLSTELGALQGRLVGFCAALDAFLAADDGRCAWLELRRRTRSGPSLSFHTAPIEVAPLLRRALFERFDTAVLTSATLAVDRRFDYLHERLGIAALEPRERVQTLRVESPFDFFRQALLLVPADLPDPQAPAYEPALHGAIRETLRLTGGGTFVLFTAYGALNRAFGALDDEARSLGLTLLRQGETGRHLLLTRFVRNPRAVLLATDSFWEGVDVKGDALRCVVIARLPFKVPTEPIERARVEAIQARGGDPFVDHALPQAIIKLAQGFGRLIRSRGDRGCVLILDSRIARRPYGRSFFASLPPARRVVGPSRRVFAEMAAFFRPS
jgi:ATP-dependent DNA helicase DinG